MYVIEENLTILGLKPCEVGERKKLFYARDSFYVTRELIFLRVPSRVTGIARLNSSLNNRVDEVGDAGTKQPKTIGDLYRTCWNPHDTHRGQRAQRQDAAAPCKKHDSRHPTSASRRPPAMLWHPHHTIHETMAFHQSTNDDPTATLQSLFCVPFPKFPAIHWFLIVKNRNFIEKIIFFDYMYWSNTCILFI